MAEKRHPGIDMHKFTVGAGFEGLVFTVGCALIFVFGLPALWYFVALSVVLGLSMAMIFRLLNDRRSRRLKPLSILQVHERTEGRALPAEDKPKNLFPAPRELCST
jgi:hypothetical protein